MATRRGLTSCLKHRDFRFFVAAFFCDGIGGWAYNVALTVWIFDQTGSVTYVTVALVARCVPAMLLGAYGGVVADRLEKISLMRTLALAGAVVMVLVATLMFAGAPVALVIAGAAVASVLNVIYLPAGSGATPLLVPERDLGSANALRNTIANITVIAGPGVGALLLLFASAPGAVLFNAAAFLLSALLLSFVQRRSTRADVTVGGTAGPLRQMLVGVAAMGSSVGTAMMVGYALLATFAFGVDTVLFVAVSDHVLGTGANGYGYLLAGLGVGGVLAAPLVARAQAFPRLAPVIIGGMAVYTLPTLVFVVTGSPVLAFAVQIARGAGTLFVDVLAETAMQRSLPSNVLARVFGAFNVMMIAVILAGSALATLSLSTIGLSATIWAAGGGIFAISLVGLPGLVVADRVAGARRAELAPIIAILESCDLFDEVDDGDLVQLADVGEQVTFAAGSVVIAEGEPAEAFFVVVAGIADVRSRGANRAVPALGPGDYFGEIGLIENVARTATVTADTEVRLLEFPGQDFVAALTSYKPSVAIMEAASLRMRRTHPDATLQHAGLATDTT